MLLSTVEGLSAGEKLSARGLREKTIGSIDGTVSSVWTTVDYRVNRDRIEKGEDCFEDSTGKPFEGLRPSIH